MRVHGGRLHVAIGRGGGVLWVDEGRGGNVDEIKDTIRYMGEGLMK